MSQQTWQAILSILGQGRYSGYCNFARSKACWCSQSNSSLTFALRRLYCFGWNPKGQRYIIHIMIIFWLLHVLLPLDGQNWCEVIEGSRLYGNDFHLFSKATSDPYVRVRLADDETWTKPVTKCGLIIFYHVHPIVPMFPAAETRLFCPYHFLFTPLRMSWVKW